MNSRHTLTALVFVIFGSFTFHLSRSAAQASAPACEAASAVAAAEQIRTLSRDFTGLNPAATENAVAELVALRADLLGVVAACEDRPVDEITAEPAMNLTQRYAAPNDLYTVYAPGDWLFLEWQDASGRVIFTNTESAFESNYQFVVQSANASELGFTVLPPIEQLGTFLTQMDGFTVTAPYSVSLGRGEAQIFTAEQNQGSIKSTTLFFIAPDNRFNILAIVYPSADEGLWIEALAIAIAATFRPDADDLDCDFGLAIELLVVSSDLDVANFLWQTEPEEAQRQLRLALYRLAPLLSACGASILPEATATP